MENRIPVFSRKPAAQLERKFLEILFLDAKRVRSFFRFRVVCRRGIAALDPPAVRSPLFSVTVVVVAVVVVRLTKGECDSNNLRTLVPCALSPVTCPPLRSQLARPRASSGLCSYRTVDDNALLVPFFFAHCTPCKPPSPPPS